MYSKLNIALRTKQPHRFYTNDHMQLGDELAQSCALPQISPEAEVGWAAGIFDGDGAVMITKCTQPGRKNPTYRLVLSFVQNDHPTVKEFDRRIGVHSYLVEVKRDISHNDQVYDLRYDGLHAVSALKKMLPHLVRKHMKAQLALRLWQDGRMGVLPGPHGLDSSVWETREYYFNKMKKLK